MVSASLWEHFAGQFGLENILPIALAGDGVESTLPAGAIGKVPSIFNAYGQIVGFKDWQTGRAKASDLERWKQDARYGFGVRLGVPLPGGGVAIAIDCDTENEAHLTTIERLICDALNIVKIPQRVRTNSNRRTFIVRVETADQLPKEVFKLGKNEAGKQEAIEFLAYGQQFVAAGRHPSGVDIEWLDGSARDFVAEPLLPQLDTLSLSLEQFTALKQSIADALPVEETGAATARNRAGKGAAVPADAVALYLDENGWTLKIGKEGERHIRSPFADEYTNEQGNGDTSVTYFLPGTRNYEQGHFVSKHASDAARSNADFLDAIGFVRAQFESLPTQGGSNSSASDKKLQPRPVFTQVTYGKDRDKIENTLVNCLNALAYPSWLGYEVAYDTFAGNIVIRRKGQPWLPFTDVDYVTLRVELETRNFVPVGRDLIKDAVLQQAQRHQIDTAMEWGKKLKWDGVKRIGTFLHDYMSTSNDDYTKALSLYLWTALAGRLLVPGIKADMMPVLVGDQGCGKSTGVEALSPDLRWFVEMSFHDNDADQARKMRGALVAEFAEMNGLRTRAIEAIKAMVTRTRDKWVAKYQEHTTEYLRRCLFIGTSNDDELLHDSTGNRRWLPVRVGKVDVEGIRRDCEQLWAEAIHVFKKTGIAYQAVTAAVGAFDIHETYRATDPAEIEIREWLTTATELDGSTPASKGYVTTNEVIKGVGQNVGVRLDRAGQIRIGKALLALGCKKSRKVINNSFASVYLIDSKKLCITDSVTVNQ